MDRRSFLAVGAGTILLGACGGGKGGTSTDAAGSSTGNTHDDPDLVLVPDDWDYFTGQASRLAILIASNKQSGAPIALNSPVTIRIGPEKGPLGPAIPMTIHANGPEPVYALTTYTFPTAGIYQLQAAYKGKTTSLPITVTDPSSSTVPVIGQKMISVPTPTVATPLGVNPVCTQQPPCPFHAVSLDAALAHHQQIALVFATPALCQSRFCGPVLSNVQAVYQPWAASVTFIHCEIYTDLSGQTTSKPVRTWNLEHEPMLYLAGADGVIKARVDNLFDRDEAKSVLQAAFGPG